MWNADMCNLLTSVNVFIHEIIHNHMIYDYSRILCNIPIAIYYHIEEIGALFPACCYCVDI
jgi:hypothetical protein